MEDELRNWLRSFGLQEYEERFEKDGWEKLDDIFHIDEDDLNACIHKAGHRKIFHRAVQETKATGVHPPVEIQDANKEALIPFDEDKYNDSKAKDVEIWLKSIGLGHYISNFQTEGWDRLEVMNDMDEQDISSCIDKPGHRKKFQIALKEDYLSFVGRVKPIKLSTSFISNVLQEKEDVKTWLKKHGLELYFDRLDQDGWDTLQVLFELGETEEDLKKCIFKPGHRKRFQLAVTGERSTGKQDVSLSDNLPKEKVDVQMTSSSESKHLAMPRNDLQDKKSDLLTVRDETASSQDNRNRNTKGSFKDNFVGEGSTVKQEAGKIIYERHTVNQEDTETMGQTELEKQPVMFGLSDEENEGQSTTDVSNNQHLDSVEINFTGGSSGRESTEDDAEVDTCDDNEGKLDSDSGCLQRTFSMPPSTIYIQKIQNFHKPNNVAIQGKIVDASNRTFSTDAKKKYRDNFRKQMKTALEVSKEKDSFFVETRAYKELQKKVQDTNWGVITGIPGDGKTSMAVHLSLQYHMEGYDHLELHFARDWKDWVEGSSGPGGGKKQFILIDDIFGRMSIDERKVNEWSSIINLMQNVVKQRQGDLKVVCTSRKYVFEDVKTKLAQFASFQEPMVIDMTRREFALIKDEKEQIWTAYEKKFTANVQMPISFLGEESKGTLPHGFPHCVDLYFNSPSLQNEEDFFDNPMECICRELDNFKDNDKMKYFALLQVLFNDNKLTDIDIESMIDKPGYKTRVSAAGLSTRPTSTDLKKALIVLRGTYITEHDGCYSISHDSIRENLAFVFIKQNPVYAIQNMDFDYLTDHTNCPGQANSDNPHSRLMYTLNPQCNGLLVNRMILEIKRGNVVSVCAHQAWDDTDFVADLIRCLFRMSEENYAEQYGCSRIANVFNTKDSSMSYIFDFSLFDALRFFGHKKAVKQILQSPLGTLLDESQGEIERPKEIDFEKPLSLRLYRIMNTIGASPELREFQIHSAISMELLDTVCAYIAGEKFRCYIFGSHSEGTRIITHIPKRDCDVNYLFCLKNTEVVQDLSEIKPDQKTQYLLAVADAITRPGYVKLQIVNNGIPETKAKSEKRLFTEDTTIDHQDRVVLCKRRPDKIHVDEVKGLIATTDIVTAKANTATETEAKHVVARFDNEIYHSYRCRSWPKIATKWISRNRHYNWPSRSIIEQLKSLGVFLVPIGSQGSFEKNLEWKILFLLQERMLISTLNDTQYKCYIILKMINNDIISKRFDEPVLVTYHLKTCLFYAIENTPKSLWQQERLLDCLQVCLKRILQCATEGNCPNYFIPQDDLFYRRVRGEVQTKLTNVLEDLLACNVSFWYLPTITCGNLGPRLEQDIFGRTDTVQTAQDLVPSTVRLYLKLIKFLSTVKMRILCKCYDNDPEKCVRLHFEEAVQKLHKAEEIIDHSKEQTEKALFLVLPYVELSLMSVLIARQLDMPNGKETVLPLLMSKKWKQIGLFIPTRLKQATFLHMCGKIDASLRVLRSLKQSMNPHMISVCGCQYHHTIVDGATSERIKYMPEPEFRKSMCVSCVAFLPTEQEIIPGVLGCEMKRAKANPESNPTATFHFWYNWAVVDGKVLMYLILYLNYRALSHDSHTMMLAEVPADIRRRTDDVIKELQSTINDDPNLGHKETGLNILGWIYKQEGLEDEAERCFRDSLEIQSAYNAANLHMEELVYYG